MAAAVLTFAAVAQQLLLFLGLGGLLPGSWQPWPFLLGAAPAWWLARPLWWRADLPRPLVVAIRMLRRIPGAAYLVAVLALAAGIWAALQHHEPYLGHEEAVYANKARSWADGAPDAGWGPYRPVGLPALGRLALGVHDGVGSLRVVALLLTLFTLTTTYMVAARWTTPRRAVVVVLLLLSGLGFLRRLPEFLNDIGTTGLLLIVVFLLTRAQEVRHSRALPLAATVAVGAFYLRYGSVGNLLAISLAALFAYGPRAWLAQGRRLAAALAIFGLGLLPHFVQATQVTGSPLGLILWAGSQANRAYVGDGLVYYLAIFPYRLAGDLGAVVMTSGLLLAVRALRGKDCGSGLAARHVFLGSASVAVFVVLGLATDGEPRFVYLPVVLLTVLGVESLAQLTGRRNRDRGLLAAVAGLAGVTIAATTQAVAHSAMPGPDRLSRSTVPVAQRLASNEPCLLVTGYEPETGWYSGCNAVTYAQYRRMTPSSEEQVTLILFEHGRLQPDSTTLSRLIGDRDTIVRTIPTDGTLGTATAITLTH
ncbi:glycosyltransferase [Streptomyces sp. NPDC057456]|uniref:glycosyltransferase n=1 Tax=Streptomyces sp. NPDC057456 TaxID=3346139 RepID=UPI00369CE2FB